jgi:hypothetical protein
MMKNSGTEVVSIANKCEGKQKWRNKRALLVRKSTKTLEILPGCASITEIEV